MNDCFSPIIAHAGDAALAAGLHGVSMNGPLSVGRARLAVAAAELHPCPPIHPLDERRALLKAELTDLRERVRGGDQAPLEPPATEGESNRPTGWVTPCSLAMLGPIAFAASYHLPLAALAAIPLAIVGSVNSRRLFEFVAHRSCERGQHRRVKQRYQELARLSADLRSLDKQILESELILAKRHSVLEEYRTLLDAHVHHQYERGALARSHNIAPAWRAPNSLPEVDENHTRSA